MAKRLSQQTRQHILNKAAQGASVPALAAQYGIDHSTIYQWMKRAGIPTHRQVVQQDTSMRIELYQKARDAGMTQRQAAQACGISQGRIYCYEIAHGLRKPASGKQHTSSDVIDQALACVKAGQSPVKVAAAYGVDFSTVYSWMRKRGVEGKRGSARTRDTKRQRAYQLAKEGMHPAAIARVVGVGSSTVRRWLDNDSMGKTVVLHAAASDAETAGANMRVGNGNALSFAERCRIEALCTTGTSMSQIAALLGRSRSVISRELARNGTRSTNSQGVVTIAYSAEFAQRSAQQRARRPKQLKLQTQPRLRAVVIDKMARRWSPGRISAWLKAHYGHDESMQISHEAIYQAVYVQSKGSLRQAIEAEIRRRSEHDPKKAKALIRGGTRRVARTRSAGGVMKNKSWIYGAEISKRPPEVDDRAIPGHWEGDLVIGAGGKSALITLIERSSRYTLLGHLPVDRTSATVVDVIQKMVKDLTAEQFKTLTWDQGSEMALTATVSIADGVDVYFCDPHSPWQRPTNENTNGEIRRRFYPKDTDFAEVTPQHVAWVQDELNETPRIVLGGYTPREKLHELFEGVAFTA